MDARDQYLLGRSSAVGHHGENGAASCLSVRTVKDTDVVKD